MMFLRPAGLHVVAIYTETPPHPPIPQHPHQVHTMHARDGCTEGRATHCAGGREVVVVVVVVVVGGGGRPSSCRLPAPN